MRYCNTTILKPGRDFNADDVSPGCPCLLYGKVGNNCKRIFDSGIHIYEPSLVTYLKSRKFDSQEILNFDIPLYAPLCSHFHSFSTYFPWLDFSRLLDYCFGDLKEKHCLKNETLAIFSGSNHGCPGLCGVIQSVLVIQCFLILVYFWFFFDSADQCVNQNASLLKAYSIQRLP